MGYSKRHLLLFEEQDCVKNRHITVTFKLEHQLSDCASKAVLVRLSDEDDLYFLYTTCISDKDFSNIKAQQGLLVDFDGFSQRVIDLLELCRREECNSTPKYVLKFTRSLESGRKIGVLRIVEATNFKYLTHLSLNLLPADDELLKSYLVEQLKNLRIQSNIKCNELEESIKRTTFQLSKTEELLMQTQEEFEKYKVDAEAREKAIEVSCKTKISSLEENLSKTIVNFETSANTAKNLAAESMEQLRSEFSSKLVASEQEIKRLQGERTQLQEYLSSTQTKLQASCEKNNSLTEELSSLRNKLDTAELTNHNQANTVARLESRIGALENELANKDHLLSKTQDLLSNEQEQRARLQEQLQRQTRHMEKVEKSLEKESEEVNKANEIIRRLQNEVKSHHTKAKLRGQVAAEQERLLSSKETELQQLQTELERTKSDLKTTRETATSLSNQLKAKSDELAEAQRTIKTNENIIGWLNRQISENQMGQVQQRLKSSGFPTPIPPLSNGTARILSPAFSSATTTAWQPTSARLITLNQPTLMGNVTTAVTPVSSTANTNLGLRPASSLPSYTCASASGSMIPTSTLHQVPELDKETGYGKLQKPVDSHMKAVISNPCTLPAPITKSTPMHTDNMILGKMYSADVTVRSARATVSGNAPSTDATNRLPTYLPSVLTMRSQTSQNQATAQAVPRIGYPDHVGPEATKPTSTSSGQDDSERTLHQQSLSSAYFPKPVGAQTQR